MSATSAERVAEVVPEVVEGHVVPASKPTRGRGKPWSKEEDESICIAWLEISQDPIISTNQKVDKMYARILNKFMEICANKGIVADYRSRTSQAVNFLLLQISVRLSANLPAVSAKWKTLTKVVHRLQTT
uniref:(northern house mosquito) hypothetical protein n=1 Tax=Culex pipiens TaxID=7175 RepID=A0A8D8J164_CULPI